MPTDRLFLVCAVVLVACLLLGGGTRAGFLSDTVIQLAAIPLLLIALQRLAGLPTVKGFRWALLFCLAVVLVPLLQLVPLPPEVWTQLPNREALIETFGLLHRDLPWMPVSVSPRATWLSALSLLAPIAIFLGTLLLGYRERRALSLILIAVGVVSAFLGLAQVAGGPNSPLRFFEITNRTEAVGFFANRNHFSAALYALMLFAAAWAVEAASPPARGRALMETRWVVPLIASFTVLVILVAAQAIARSRAGLGLTIVALVAAIALAFRDRRMTTGVTPARVMLAATALAVMFAAQFALFRLSERFAEDPLKDGRAMLVRITSEAAQRYMPVGSGMGTFVPVYAMQQRPEEAPLDSYVNRAHNDIVEIWLEAGVAGAGLLALFLAWLVRRSAVLWRRYAPGGEIDVALARAATVVAALIVAHSAVDYPLRTGAMMAIMAFACGLLVPPPGGGYEQFLADGRTEGVQAKPRKAAGARPQGSRRPANAPISQHPSERWGSDVEWPEDWR
jgi:O-antigen ligase